jgi:hypothetical protein
MKQSVKICLILTVLFFEFVWATLPRLSLHGPILDELYRHDERFKAMVAWSDHPSPQTKAVFDSEVALLDKYMAERATVVLIAVLVIDALGIFLIWKYVPTKAKLGIKT